MLTPTVSTFPPNGFAIRISQAARRRAVESRGLRHRPKLRTKSQGHHGRACRFGKRCRCVRTAIYVKRDFEWYEVLIAAMLESFKWLARPSNTTASTKCFSMRDGVDPKPLQQRILNDVGIPVTIGVSKTRSLAKLASDNAKPFGCWTATTTNRSPNLLADRPVDQITGIAKRSSRKLAMHGIKTCADFANADRRLIRRLLTKTGESLWWELNGNPVTPISRLDCRTKLSREAAVSAERPTIRPDAKHGLFATSNA